MQLSSQHTSRLIAAFIRLQSELVLLEEQRREAAAALSLTYMDHVGGKFKLGTIFMQHHRMCEQLNAIVSREHELFIQFTDDFYHVRASFRCHSFTKALE